MARQKFDGVIESVHYAADGKIAWVRVYERRGPTFSDRVILDRTTLVARLKSGKKFVTGQRIPLLSSTFDVSHPVRLLEQKNGEVILAGEGDSGRDVLANVPLV
jgi:hypothetical protein